MFYLFIDYVLGTCADSKDSNPHSCSVHPRVEDREPMEAL